jgi:uncharacterized protein (DUF4213/DUF364 family)
MTNSSLLKTRQIFIELAERSGLMESEVRVLAKPLTPEEAIGKPGRRDFPILVGVERVIEATVATGRGQAFTDSPREFEGRLKNVIHSDLETDNATRAIYIATLNATLKYLGRLSGTLHCRDDDPETCGAEIARMLERRFGRSPVGLIGLNPAIAERLVDVFGPGRVFISDLNPDNIGRKKFGVEVWDGQTRTEELISAAGPVVYTGTTLVNGTFDAIRETIAKQGKTGIVFGMTAAGVCELLGYERICPFARDR